MIHQDQTTEPNGSEAPATTFCLPRSGRWPLTITGRALVRATQSSPFPLSVELYETEDGHFVTHLSFARRPKAELLTHQTECFERLDEAVDHLIDSDPSTSLGTLLPDSKIDSRTQIARTLSAVNDGIECRRTSYRAFLMPLIRPPIDDHLA